MTCKIFEYYFIRLLVRLLRPNYRVLIKLPMVQLEIINFFSNSFFLINDVLCKGIFVYHNGRRGLLQGKHQFKMLSFRYQLSVLKLSTRLLNLIFLVSFSINYGSETKLFLKSSWKYRTGFQ